MKKLMGIAAFVLIAGGAGYGILVLRGGDDEDAGPRQVVVEEGTIVEKALAMGEIVPRHEIEVKSKVSGIVARIFVEEGDKVVAGQPLLEVHPDPTPLEYAQAKRGAELRILTQTQRQADLERSSNLLQAGMASQAEHDRARELYDQAVVQRQMAEEELAILDQGRAVVAGRTVENIIKSPIAGSILDISVDVGDPVVPLTSYQPGTGLMSLADMDELLFEGTVDEIDVGKITEGMPVELKIGAFPDEMVPALLTRISLKSRKRDNATVFGVEINHFQVPEGMILRAGYSANADIIIQRAIDVPMLPERVFVFRDDSIFVRLPAADPESEPEERPIQVGMSDGINTEIKIGVALGDSVLDKETREIE
jgi:HlyD family secretion protein